MFGQGIPLGFAGGGEGVPEADRAGKKRRLVCINRRSWDDIAVRFAGVWN